MSLKTDETNDQANELRNLFEGVEKGNDEVDSTDNPHEMEKTREVDILNLPPRKEVHAHRTQLQFKIRRPLLRLLFVISILIIILIVAYYFLGNEILNISTTMLLN